MQATQQQVDHYSAMQATQSMQATQQQVDHYSAMQATHDSAACTHASPSIPQSAPVSAPVSPISTTVSNQHQSVRAHPEGRVMLPKSSSLK